MTGPRVIVPGVLELASGAIFPIEAPWLSDFTVGDVAQGLSNICRFTGQVARFYSVAEHSVHCSYLVPDHLALTALCHDAAEAFLGDIAQPLKALLPDYRRLEALAEAVVLQSLGARYPMPPAIKEADLQMLAVEKLHVLGSLQIWPALEGVKQPALRIEHWSPDVAKRAWLARYAELGGSDF